MKRSEAAASAFWFSIAATSHKILLVESNDGRVVEASA